MQQTIKLIDEETVKGMKSWSHSGFNFYAGDTISPKNSEARLYLGRYLKKPPIVPSRIEVDESGETPIIHYRHEIEHAGVLSKREKS